MSGDDKKDKKGQRLIFARVANAFKSTSRCRNSDTAVTSSSPARFCTSSKSYWLQTCLSRHDVQEWDKAKFWLGRNCRTIKWVRQDCVFSRILSVVDFFGVSLWASLHIDFRIASAITFCEETTPNTETNEIIESLTESTTINTLPHPSIALVELSSTNNESVDNPDGPENPVSLNNSPHGLIQLEESRPSHSRDPFGDQERTENRYKKAVKWLEESLSLPRTNLEPFVIPDFTDISKNDSVGQLRQEIKKILDVRSSSMKDRSFWSKGKHIMELTFISISPFIKNILLVGKSGSSVYSLSNLLLT